MDIYSDSVHAIPPNTPALGSRVMAKLAPGDGIAGPEARWLVMLVLL